LPDGSIIRACKTNQQVGVVSRIENGLERAQDLRQRFRVQLGRSTRAGRKACQADLFSSRILFRHVFSKGWTSEVFLE